MDELYCDRCGNVLVLDTDGDWYCSNCNIWFSIPDDFKESYKDPKAYLSYEETESEQGCTACGNPLYPQCKDSCPLFDN